MAWNEAISPHRAMRPISTIRWSMLCSRSEPHMFVFVNGSQAAPQQICSLKKEWNPRSGGAAQRPLALSPPVPRCRTRPLQCFFSMPMWWVSLRVSIVGKCCIVLQRRVFSSTLNEATRYHHHHHHHHHHHQRGTISTIQQPRTQECTSAVADIAVGAFCH